MSNPTTHFESQHHALAAGVLMGALMRVSAEEDVVFELSVEQPLTDVDGNYTNQLLVRIAGEPYTVTIEPSLVEAMRDAGLLKGVLGDRVPR